MKVRISIPGIYMVMDMKEEQAHTAFRKMAEMLWLINSKNQERPAESRAEQEKEQGITELDSLKEPEFEPSENPSPYIPPMVPEQEPPSMQETNGGVEPYGKEIEEEAVEPKMISSGYGGFLYIKCPDCGKIKGFCAKTRLNNFRCDCGSVTRLEHMVPLYMNCECGRNSKYLTNMEEAAFDITCYDCGSPVAVSWNPKKRQYETIR